MALSDNLATSPSAWPGLWPFLRSVWQEIEQDRVFMIAAGVTFYALLSVIPAMAATVTLYGLFADPADIARMAAELSDVLPKSVVDLSSTELQRLALANSQALGLASVLGLAIALWGAHGGLKGLIEALNIAYDTPETRSFLHRTALALGFAVLGSALVVAVVLLAPALPALLAQLPGGYWLDRLLLVLRWPLLVLLLAAGLGALYAFGPNRPERPYRWITPGALLAALMVVVGSAAFAYYLNHYAAYDQSYGALAAAIALMTGLWLATLSVLFGAEVNAELDRLSGQRPAKRVLSHPPTIPLSATDGAIP